MIRPVGTPNVVEVDVFPPLRAQAQDPSSIFLPYIAEDIAFEEEYEEYLSDLGFTMEQPSHSESHQWGGSGVSAWHRLPEFGSNMADGISDSESVGSIGELGDDARLELPSDDRTLVDENLNNWEVCVVVIRAVMLLATDGFLPRLAYEPEDDEGAGKISCRPASVKWWIHPSTGHPAEPRRRRWRERCRPERRQRRWDPGWSCAKVSWQLCFGGWRR